MRTSYLLAGLHGTLNIVIGFMLYTYWNQMDINWKLLILSMVTLNFGIHGLLHHAEEIYYDFNPLEGKWIPKERTFFK